MASRVIARGKKYLLEHLNVPARPYSSFSSFGHERFAHDANTRIMHRVSKQNTDNADCQEEAAAIAKEDLLRFYAKGFLKHPPSGIYVASFRYGRQDFTLPLGVRWLSQSVHTASTATAGQPEMGGGEEQNEDQNQKQIKEVLPEECDQAVEGLSTAKAKAKAKQMQESKKTTQSMIHKFWARLLGIGPALRAVASMSRISSRLLLKLAGGKNLTRRERQQLTRTTVDIFRLVPFAVFIIVPFMEFLLPVFLKLFPNMLPSTFQDKMKEQEALKRKLQARIEYAKFLQDTLKEMAKEIQTSRSGEIKQTAEDLDEFLNKVRTGARVSNDEILSFAKLFNDELTLDNISRPRLVNMCKYMGIPPFGTDNYLRYMLRRKLQK
ncbi:LETM1-like protein [Cocos nucifera]|uniref:LETM1-like protein n=1 Tax=Cocos nucifera TaxID=13894 RepID=A0A8K0HZN2_COCNU|nr:LETM1-like protein [Cocos nucifera]